jgi:hypothetical protein
LLKGIAHVLKVRVIADMDDRIRVEMQRENISRTEAVRALRRDDAHRRKWSKYLFGIDTSDPSLYDLVIHIRKIAVNEAVNLICSFVEHEQFKTTPESQKAADDLLLACEVRAALMSLRGDVEVRADDGIVSVSTKAPIVQEDYSAHLNSPVPAQL